jgi:hypothetical protein
MVTVLKRKLSGSTDGLMIKVAATATLGTTIHTAVAGTTAGTFDEVWLYVTNNHTAAVDLTIEYGGATNPDCLIQQNIPAKQGLYFVLPGFILQNGKVVTAFASVANVICIGGWVNTITDA